MSVEEIWENYMGTREHGAFNAWCAFFGFWWGIFTQKMLNDTGTIFTVQKTLGET